MILACSIDLLKQVLSMCVLVQACEFDYSGTQACKALK